jgi:hypothetical protein
MTESVVLASVYRITAANFRSAAETLAATLELKDDGSPAKLTAIPFYFLVSHATELLLKSALLKRGYVENDLKHYDYRHNLSSLLVALQQKGVLVTTETINLIEGLHLQHQTHALRYTALADLGRTTFMPPVSSLFEMLDELLLLKRLSTQGV